MHPEIDRITRRIERRSQATRCAYLVRIHKAAASGPSRVGLSCSNLAHGIAALGESEKKALTGSSVPNIGIVSAYNDMLSAHQPFEAYPALIRKAAAEQGATAQFAGGVPAMCDGVTQGQDGMDLSLFSRDVIAMSTAIALSHNMFDGALCLGVCDKIVPGLLIGALSFGHLPAVFVPAGPMISGLPNKEKARIREEYAAGRVGRAELLAAESASYHSPGTCTFYGTANSNQMLMEFMGLQLPGGSFVNPDTELRRQLTAEAVRALLGITDLGDNYIPLAEIVSEKAIVNAIVGLLATGGSTNHTLHLTAIAKAAGVMIDWSDFADLSAVVPLLARIYPNGLADVNHFHAAGGLGFTIRQLLEAGFLHNDVRTIRGDVGGGRRRSSHSTRTFCAPWTTPSTPKVGYVSSRATSAGQSSRYRPSRSSTTALPHLLAYSQARPSLRMRSTQVRSNRISSRCFRARVLQPTGCQSCISSRRTLEYCKTADSKSRC
jgi:phosphogluconate dehydratase